jgi:hypothetical protein
MPRKVVVKYRDRYSSKGKIHHRATLLPETDYTIVQRYQSVLQGLYNYYCMAVNVGNNNRMSRIKWMLEISLTKTLAFKHQCRVPRIYDKYGTEILGLKALQVVIQRSGKKPLVATFGGISFRRIPDGIGVVNFRFVMAWNKPVTPKAEVVQRLLAGKCELCGVKDEPTQVHHIRKLADINKPGRRPKQEWERRMSAMKRKTLVVCLACHTAIHAGSWDGSAL